VAPLTSPRQRRFIVAAGTGDPPGAAVDFIGLDADPDHFDAGCLRTNETPVVLEDEIRFYYDAEPIRGDALRHAVAWKGQTLRDLPPGLYSLRLHLAQAEVFAVTLKNGKN